MTAKRTGRPSSYSEAEVLKGIEIVERQGGLPSGDSVKKAMCEELSLPGGINAQSLDREVGRLLAERETRLNESLVANLPDSSRAAADEIGGRVTRDIVTHIAREFDKLRGVAGKQLVEKEEDLQLQRGQIRALQARIEEKDASIANLELTNADLVKHIEMAKAEISSLNEQVATLRKAEELEALVMTTVTKALENGALKVA